MAEGGPPADVVAATHNGLPGGPPADLVGATHNGLPGGPPADLVGATREWLPGGRLAHSHGMALREGRFLFAEDDAHLVLAPEKPLRPGWYALDVRMETEIPLRPRVYVGLGETFSETAAFNLKKGPTSNYSAFFRIGGPAAAIRFHPSRFRFEADIVSFRLRRIGLLELAGAGWRAARSSLKRGPAGLARFLIGAAKTLTSPGFDSFDTVGASKHVPLDRIERFRKWVALDEQRSARLALDLELGHVATPADPGFDLIVPIALGPDLAARAAALAAMAAEQILPPRRLRLMVCGPAEALADLPPGTPPVEICAMPAGTAPVAAVMAGLAEPGAAFAVILPEDARLARHALLDLARALAEHSEADLLYCDEDRVDPDGTRHGGLFRPAWSEAHFLSRDYLGQTLAIRRAALPADLPDGAGGPTAAILALAARPGAIRHVAEILVHRHQPADPPGREGWDMVEARRAVIAGNLAGEADVAPIAGSDALRVAWRLPDPPPLVSIIVPTRDRVELLKTCIGSLTAKTSYPAYEILIVDNGSVEPATLAWFAEATADPRIRVLPYPHPFNFSAINNFAAGEARGEVLLLLNNDTEVIAPGWLDEMVGWVMRPGIGAVGAKLYFPDGKIQHAGVAVLSRHGVAGHLHLGEAGGARGYHDRLVAAQDLTAVTAACLAVRASVYREVGGLDAENLKVAFNDVDFCLKIRRAGYRIVWTPHAELIHHESVSRGDDMSPAHKARFLSEVDHMARVWGPELERDPFYSRHFDRSNCNFMPRVE